MHSKGQMKFQVGSSDYLRHLDDIRLMEAVKAVSVEEAFDGFLPQGWAVTIVYEGNVERLGTAISELWNYKLAGRQAQEVRRNPDIEAAFNKPVKTWDL